MNSDNISLPRFGQKAKWRLETFNILSHKYWENRVSLSTAALLSHP